MPGDAVAREEAGNLSGVPRNYPHSVRSKTYVLQVPAKSEAGKSPSLRTDHEALRGQLNDLLQRIGDAGETVVSIIPIAGGWGTAFQNQTEGQRLNNIGSAAGGLGFSFTDALVVLVNESETDR
jgi:hypothetical protein